MSTLAWSVGGPLLAPADKRRRGRLPLLLLIGYLPSGTHRTRAGKRYNQRTGHVSNAELFERWYFWRDSAMLARIWWLRREIWHVAKRTLGSWFVVLGKALLSKSDFFASRAYPADVTRFRGWRGGWIGTFLEEFWDTRPLKRKKNSLIFSTTKIFKIHFFAQKQSTLPVGGQSDEMQWVNRKCLNVPTADGCCAFQVKLTNGRW